MSGGCQFGNRYKKMSSLGEIEHIRFWVKKKSSIQSMIFAYLFCRMTWSL